MKFFVDTADVAEIDGLKAFPDDWAKTGQSIL